ncbi:hypothetical protein [Winogradskyella bathintestinalis]|uniref:Serine kinase n=1 Tax=Winogradskyella bathintestinalis TaxID=3035208 RepID=A0ABT7ZSR3_9FLAO|nr:hypothetical protein [Winogradskyella bathintestinalis]MDN3492035.1 hypothetical protein [Winogradskyella bathintestinalis]
MYNNLAPTYKHRIGDYWALWYAVSNSYSIIDHEFNLLLEAYLHSATKSDFLNTISDTFTVSECNGIIDSLFNYLSDCNKPYNPTEFPSTALDTSFRHITKTYSFGGKTIEINYDSELVLKTIHPALAHFCINTHSNTTLATFDVYLNNDDLFLFKDQKLISQVSKYNYHHIQGKFIMHLLCTIHGKEEHDWIGTLHGSTITDGNTSLIFVGESGRGKSTLSALLTTNTFHLLADDVSPLLAEDQHIYYNPSAISIKAGAFNLLQPLVSNFDKLPIVEFNKSKGKLKYIPSLKPKEDHYPCKAIILVDYQPNAATQLEHLSVKTILETIIPDSWLSPDPEHAQQFLDWLSALQFHKLTYSDTESVTDEISELFQQLK